MKKALIVWGGWDGHEPELVARRFASWLEESGFEAELCSSLEALSDAERLSRLDLLVPVWTMGELGPESTAAVLGAAAGGMGVAGCHGGMCDAFRANCDWQFMTGGQWVAHPGNDGVEYEVRAIGGSSPIVEGIDRFTVRSEQYYMHVDPAVRVLAVTEFPVVDGPHAANGRVDMPVAWTKRWGAGRIFYCSLGHHADVFDAPEARAIMSKGMVWAAREEMYE